jgi:decaprenyl-phosphate phosphoribosyltransferase
MSATARTNTRLLPDDAARPRQLSTGLGRAATPRRRPGQILLQACRPKQWVKNVLVAIAPAAAGALTRPSAVVQALAAFVAFCLLASATYLVNDVRDREQDRCHPRKRYRPVAAGQLSSRGAKRIATVLAVLGLTISFAVRLDLGVVAIGYLTLTIGYSVWWRRVFVLDIVAVAGGFLLRAVAGGAATGVPLSSSFLVVSAACAVFLVAGKRYAELADAGAGGATRATLRRYSPKVLRYLLLGAAALGCLAYARWAFERPDLGPWFSLSAVPFILWLGRYASLLRAGAGEAPEELILRDHGLLVLGTLWAVLFLVGVHAAR